MIVTLTPHPSLDRILTVQSTSRGELNHSAYSLLEPGGDGLNVTRALLTHDVQTTAVLPIGGATGQALAFLLTGTGVPYAPVPVAGSLPVRTIVLESDGMATTFQEDGPTLDSAAASALLARTDDQLHDADWLAVCGPLATGLPEDFYATAIRRAHTYDTRVAVSAQGRALSHALAAGPDLVSLTCADLADVLERDVSTVDDAHHAGEALVRRGLPIVLVTLDTGDVMLLTDRESCRARVIGAQPGCGLGGAPAALLAGVLHAVDQGEPADQALARGAAWAASLQHRATRAHLFAPAVPANEAPPGTGGTPSRAA